MHGAAPLFVVPGSELLLDIGQAPQFFFHLLDIQQLRVAGIELGEGRTLLIAHRKILVVIEVALVRRDAVKIAHVDRVRALLVRQQRFVHFLAVADADGFDRIVRVEQFLDRLGQVADRARGSFLHEDVAAFGMLKRKQHQVYRFVERHDEPRHFGDGHGHRLSRFDLLDKQRHDRAARAKHIAVARAADQRFVGGDGAGFRDEHLLHHRFGGAHRVDRIGRLVGGQADHFSDAGLDRRGQHVIGSDDVRFDRLEREKLAGRHLFERRRVEDIIHAVHRVFQAGDIPHVAEVIFDFVVVVQMPHIVLFFFVAGKNADFSDVGVEKAAQHGVAEAAGAAGDH